jgi:hypothetical protein
VDGSVHVTTFNGHRLARFKFINNNHEENRPVCAGAPRSTCFRTRKTLVLGRAMNCLDKLYSPGYFTMSIFQIRLFNLPQAHNIHIITDYINYRALKMSRIDVPEYSMRVKKETNQHLGSL